MVGVNITYLKSKVVLQILVYNFSKMQSIQERITDLDHTNNLCIIHSISAYLKPLT